MSQFNIAQAKRELIWTKLALMGASGSGKTFSSLRLASGMLESLVALGQGKNGKILLANTEASRGRYYANEFQYDIIDIGSPHNPEKYVELVDYVVENDYPILIIDSTSHEWEGKGGCLELHQQAGGTFQSWAKVTPRHDKFIQAIADSPIHLIATMRGKDQYEIEKNETGKNNVKKLGVGAQQRNGFEYEFTATFSIDKSVATVQKDNTHIFQDSSGEILSEKFGKDIIKWANSGEGYTPPVRVSEKSIDSSDKTEVMKMIKEKGGAKNKPLVELIKKYEPSGNPNKITDTSAFTQLKIELESIQSI